MEREVVKQILESVRAAIAEINEFRQPAGRVCFSASSQLSKGRPVCRGHFGLFATKVIVSAIFVASLFFSSDGEGRK